MLSIVGGGKMGFALLSGLVADGHEVTVVERDPARRETLSGDGRFAVSATPVDCEGAIIAVKPKDVELAVSDAVSAGAGRVLSIAAGITLAKLHSVTRTGVPVLRAMPNLGALVGRSATALTGGSSAHEEDLVWAESVLRSVGDVVRVPEEQMDAVTGLSGSGPAYLFAVAEALIDAGVNAGLSHDSARRLTVETMAGAAAVLAKTTKTPAEMRADVTTPAGTSAAGLRVLEQRAIRAAFIDAVAAAAERSHALGAPPQH